MPNLRLMSFILLLPVSVARAQDTHIHPAPEQLGAVSFATSCEPAAQAQFNRGVALLHSFAYGPAREAFLRLTNDDPHCAIAHWGVAISYFHQLWEPPLAPDAIPIAQKEIELGLKAGPGTPRETEFLQALALIYQDAATVPYRARVSNYERAMRDLASKNPGDGETQVFYALALLANASPGDKTHAKQKQAADLLEQARQKFPQHPGIVHYLIHACDNAELAPRGLSAARAYSQIAPSAPHALHMPSHIFTRLGLWDDSIHSNLAARDAAHEQGDTGEELHSMDYLLYAYLQNGREADAAQVIDRLQKMLSLDRADFKIAYCSTVMPVRYAIERRQWTYAAAIVPPEGAPPQVVAIAVWARGIGLARSGHPSEAAKEVARLQQIEEQLRTAGKDYWATQTSILRREVVAWSAHADHKSDQALSEMRQAADDEDSVEKLPITPGPIVPAREQLGEMLLAQDQPALALKEFRAALVNAPERRGALQGAERAVKLTSRK